jgi:hypothetical protein
MDFDTLRFFSMYSPILPLIFLLLKRAPIRISGALFLFLLVPLTAEMSCDCIQDNFKNCNPIFHIYTITFGLLISYLFYRQINKKFISILILIASSLLLTVSIYEFTYASGYLKNNPYSYNFLTIYSILLCLIYFYFLLIELQVEKILHHSFFWVSAALLIYFGATFSISLFEGFVRAENDDLLMAVWPIQLITTIIYNIILTIAFWNLKRT